MDRARLDRWCRWGIACLLLGILGWGLLATGAMRPQDFLVIEGLAIVAGGLWCVRLWVSPEPRIFMPAIAWPVLLFIGYAVVRYYTAELEYVARKELVRMVVYALVFFVAVNHLHRQKQANLVMLAVIGLATLIAAYAFYQYVTKLDRVWHFIRPAQYTGRGSGTYICPNHLAGMLELLLPLALSYLFWGKQKPLGKVLLVYGAAWLCVGIGVSLSRGGWVATALGLLMFAIVLMGQRRYRLWAGAFVCVLVLSGGIFEAKTQNVKKRFTTDNPADFAQQVEMRQAIWQSAYGLWKDHFWWGAGPGHFDYRFRPYRPPRMQWRPGQAHNDYLNVLSDWGVGGAVLLGSALALFFRAGWRYWAKRLPGGGNAEAEGEGKGRRVLVIGGVVGVLTFLMHSVVDYNLYVPANALLFVVMVAMVIANCEGTHGSVRVKLGYPAITGLTLAVVVAAVYLGGQLRAGFSEWRWVARADNETQDVRRQIAALEGAFAMEPTNFETAYRIGEICRMLSWERNGDEEAWATKAMEWFARSSRLNRFDPYSPMRQGMCLDWLERHAEAQPYYERAIELDPNNADTADYQAWHYIQMEDYAAAKPWLEKALKLRWFDKFVWVYMPIVNDRLARPKPAR